ncbi:hypothetical protein DFH09DRAFT_1158974 [Mycena vulgaris]|nr:hypothetical protein DFH09DRAFT_1158974 [Mycena vulgaris]
MISLRSLLSASSSHTRAIARHIPRRNLASKSPRSKPCWNCKEPGHLAVHCPKPQLCYRCGGEGHIGGACPNPDPARAAPCFRCGGTDHASRTCARPRACYHCRSPNHLPKDCPTPRIVFEGNAWGRVLQPPSVTGTAKP